MRILHVIHRLDKEAGGTTALAISMCEALAARGHEISLFSLDRRTAGGSALPAQPAFDARLFAADMAPLVFSRQLLRALRDEVRTYDLVHTHMLYRLPQAFAAHFARRAGVPYCVQPHGALEPMLFHKRERRGAKRLYEVAIEKRNLRRASGLVYTTTGEYVASSFLHLPAPAYVVPAGLRLADYHQMADRDGFIRKQGLEGRPIILWMGRITPIKALPVLVRAFITLAKSHPDAALVIAGPDQDGERPGLERQLRAAGLANRAVFTGMIHGDEKLAALKAATMFVLPSYTENFGISAMEAMAVGCPAIVSDNVKIAPEIVAHGAGLAVPVEAARLSQAMAELLSDAPRRAAMSAAALRLAQAHDWNKVAQRLEAAYAEMITARAAPPS